ncbi:MAG: trypsin-like serine protease [Betaproteobacteria bacterium]|nr:MAG: trypsin-like serine protease [Betaproteobacteria bacterium]
MFGVVTEFHKKLDTALVTIHRAVNAALGEANFRVVDFNAALTGVFPFSDYWKLIEGSRTQRQEQWWANNVRIPVRHSGFKSNRVDPPALQKKGGERGAVAFGAKPANMVTMRDRTSRAGDSGGPVFTPAHQLVGFISMGGGKTDSRQTSIVVAERVFTELGLTLATWQNRDAWQATPPPASTAPPAPSSSSSSSAGDPFADIDLVTWS